MPVALTRVENHFPIFSETMMSRPILFSVAALATTVLAACDAGGPSTSAQVSFSVATQPAAAGASTGSETFTDGSNTLIIDRVQLVLREIELKRIEASTSCDGSGSAASSGDDSSQDTSSHDGCEQLELGPILLDLPLGAGGVAHSFTVPVTAGSYDEVEFKIHPASHDDSPDAAFVQAHPELAGVSVQVDGTFNGVGFTYTTDLSAEEEIALSPPLAIAESGTADLTLMVDLDRWFRTGAGLLVDPATANAGLGNESLVESNIRATLHAFEDENHDGRDDHGGADDPQPHD
jgi:hypothetical protein